MQYGLTIEAIIELFGEQICDCPRCKERRGAETDDEGNPLPPAYRDLANEDKNLLWHADDLGLGVQFWNGLQRRWENDSYFDPTACRAFSKMRYRVKPEGTDAAPAREPIKIQGPSGEILGSGTMLRRDGEWDFDSIEVDNQPDTN